MANFITLPDQPHSRPRLTRFQRNLLLVIAPALIAGFFAIVPTLYTVLIKERTSLSYDVVSGPSIPANHKYLRIFSIGIENTGKTPLNKVCLEVSSSNGQIDTLVTEKSALHPTILTNDPSTSSVSIQRMLPGDHLSITALTRSDAAEPILTTNVRSDEVAGIPKDPKDQDKSAPIIVGALLSAISVAGMAIAFLEGFASRRYRSEQESP